MTTTQTPSYTIHTMNTITTLDLRRKDIASLEKLVRASKAVRVTHRGKPMFILSTDLDDSGGPVPGSIEAKRLFTDTTRQFRRAISPTLFDPNKPVKDIYHDTLTKDPKYTGFKVDG